jgi:transposase InsO family protein
MCEELGLSRDSYYKYLKRKQKTNHYLENRKSYESLIIKYYKLSNKTAGYRQIRDQIEYHENIKLSDYMVYTIKCKYLKLPEIRKKRKNIGKYRVQTDKDEKTYTYRNIAENMEINDMNQVLSTDTTEVKLEQEKQNVSFIIDAYTTEILVSSFSKKLDSEFIEYNMELLNKTCYNFKNIIIHSDRGSMYKSGIYKTKTTDMNLIPSMSAPYTYTHNPWIETINGQFKDFIKNHYPKNLDELQIVLNQFVYYNNNIKIKRKLKTTPMNYRCCQS